MKLSIIMAIYNSEKYIVNAIESFIDEIDDSIELILVDDFSIDNTNKLLNKIKKKYKNKNINIIKNKKNLGAGLSKNQGLKMAKGEFVGFVDSDDTVDKNYFHNMLNLVDNQTDIVVSNIVITYDDKKEFDDICLNNIYNNKYQMFENEIDKNVLLAYWSCASSCNKIFRRNMLQRIRFSSSKMDDLMFTIPAICNARKIKYDNKNNYYYYQSSNSVTRSYSFKKNIESINELFLVVNYLQNNLGEEQSVIYGSNILVPYLCYCLVDNNYYDDYLIINRFKDNCDLYKINYNRLFNNNYLLNHKIYNNKMFKKIIRKLAIMDLDSAINVIHPNYLKNQERIFSKNNKKYENVNNYKPLVSIIIPVFNGENYIEETINNALKQTYKNIEIIVVDDGSTDNTKNIVKKYGKFVKYYHKENGGVSSALNMAISKMNGEYMSWLSHDDLLYPEKIEKQINYLSTMNNKNVVLYSNYILINEQSTQIGDPVIINKKFTNIKEYILLRGCVNGITMLIPKSILSDIGKFDEKLWCTQDYNMWYKILKKYDFIHMSDILSMTRIHSTQDTQKNPKAVSEGNKLWIMMIESVNDERKKQIEGSIFNYYYKMALHLKNSMYQETFDHCVRKCIEINPKKYKKCPLENKELNVVHKIHYCLSNYGLIETIKIIVNKFLKIAKGNNNEKN